MNFQTKTIRSFFMAGFLSLGFAFLFSSCEKESNKSAEPQQEEEQKTLQSSKLDRQVLKAMKNIDIVGTLGGQQQSRNKTNPSSTNDFSFSDPSSGYEYSETEDGVEYSEAGGSQYSESEPALRVSGPGFSRGGGVMSIGNRDIKTDYVLCASMENAFSLFGDADTADIGFSVIIGIKGDFDAVKGGLSDSAENQIEQLVYFIVYDDNAQGNYSVADMYDSNVTSPRNLAFALAFDLESESLFMSTRGSINVQSSSMSFNGRMFEFNFASLFFSEEELDRSRAVNAGGTLNCSSN